MDLIIWGFEMKCFSKVAPLMALVCLAANCLADEPSKYMFERPVPRKAYVLSISDYDHEDKLPSSIKDETTVKAKLADLGFVVTIATDEAKRNADGLRTDLKFFFSSVKRGDIVLFYYSGHGFWFRGRNFIVPSTADNADPPKQPGSDSPVDPEDLNVSVAEVVTIIDHVGAGQATIVIDACRDAPKFPMSKADALQKKVDLLQGASSLLFFAAQEGYSAEGSGSETQNSKYTGYWLKYLDQSGQPIIEAHRLATIAVQLATQGNQIPEVGGVYTGALYPAPSLQVLEEEKASWQAILTAGTEQDANFYVRRLPGSRYVAAARQWLVDREKEPKKTSTSQINPLAVENVGKFSTVISSRVFPVDANKSGATLATVVPGLTGNLEFAGAQSSNVTEAGTFSKPFVTARATISTFDRPSLSGTKNLTLNKGDSFTVSNFLRVGQTNWIEASSLDGKTLYIPDAAVPDLRNLAAAKTRTADVTFGSGDILSPPNFAALSSTVSELGAKNIVGVSIRIRPPSAADQSYAAESSRLRLTRIRSQLMGLGIQNTLIGGIIEQGKGDTPENAARVTMAINRESK
ncbi:caspase family protein [Bradyrhizobium sp. Ash2021]|uniref:caspase family protein n=1 Tax=Bradyrhizobium sp. Ash2021 TaxID=2954771 RepID=UPI0028161434|nr:caspase family protein [Bradyrhizobium sp. Ash2021]WMT76316.1 caspase family protein [Bradyrhizobium sp. Ash2021]